MKYTSNEIVWPNTNSLFSLMECYWMRESLKHFSRNFHHQFSTRQSRKWIAKKINTGSLMTLLVFCLISLSSEMLRYMTSTEMEHLTFFPQWHAVQGAHCTWLERCFMQNTKLSSILGIFFFFFFNFILFFNFTILYWFCHISTWICHRYTCVPHPEPSSHLPPSTISL